MSKMYSGSRAAMGNVMANLSASILRNIVASVFAMDPKSVILSGILPENYDNVEDNSRGNLYASKEDLKVYAFTVEKGLIEVFGTSEGYSQNADGSYNNEYRITFADCSKHKDAQFFVEFFHKEGWQQGSADWNKTTITIYGAPDWDAIEKISLVRDLQRWVKWNAEQPKDGQYDEVAIKDTISPFFQANYNVITDKGEKSLWGYDPNRGFEDLSTNVYRWEHLSGTEKPFIKIYGISLYTTINVESYTFFVVEHRDAGKSIWSIYNAPNFKSPEINAANGKRAAMLDNFFNHIHEDVY